MIWTKHAQMRMRQRRITMTMALEVPRLGVCTQPPEPELRSSTLKCRMERFGAGIQVAVVVAVEYPAPELVVVTVIDVNGG